MQIPYRGLAALGTVGLVFLMAACNRIGPEHTATATPRPYPSASATPKSVMATAYITDTPKRTPTTAYPTSAQTPSAAAKALNSLASDIQLVPYPSSPSKPTPIPARIGNGSAYRLRPYSVRENGKDAPATLVEIDLNNVLGCIAADGEDIFNKVRIIAADRPEIAWTAGRFSRKEAIRVFVPDRPEDTTTIHLQSGLADTVLYPLTGRGDYEFKPGDRFVAVAVKATARNAVEYLAEHIVGRICQADKKF